ncbi:MAG: hypothetical protein QOH77_1093 [Actinomycetota bacterium]|nr:hypothetical protein [Actinomycetota bacterium]
MDGYRRAWESNEAIIATWLDKKDEPGDTIFEWSPLIEFTEWCMDHARV